MIFYLEVIQKDGTIQRVRCISERLLVWEFKRAYQRGGLPSIVIEGQLDDKAPSFAADKYLESLCAKKPWLKTLYDLDNLP